MLLLSEKVNNLDLLRKGKNKSYAEIYSENESSVCEVLKKGKEIHASFAVTPQTAKIMTTVHVSA